MRYVSILLFAMAAGVAHAAPVHEAESAPDPSIGQEKSTDTPDAAQKTPSAPAADTPANLPQSGKQPETSERQGSSPVAVDAPLKRINVKPLSASANIPLPQDI